METPENIITLKLVVLLKFVLIFLPILMTSRWDWWHVRAYAATTIISFAASASTRSSLRLL
jgi:hypothetical protein